jgi:hypothetical protein
LNKVKWWKNFFVTERNRTFMKKSKKGADANCCTLSSSSRFFSSRPHPPFVSDIWREDIWAY